MGLSPSVDPQVTSQMQGWSIGRMLSAMRSPPSLPPIPSRSSDFSGLEECSMKGLDLYELALRRIPKYPGG